MLCAPSRCLQCKPLDISAQCLRQQAVSCIHVAKRLTGHARMGLEQLSFDLMDEAATMDRESELLTDT